MMKKLLALSLIVALIGFPLPRVRADDSDIFGANIQPNVMIQIDSSMSMQDEVPSDPYDPNTPYTVGGYTYSPNQGAVYKYDKKKYSLYASSISGVPDSDGTPTSAARDALTTSGYWNGKIAGTQYFLFTGNYMNWKAAASPTTEAKITIAKRVVTSLIQNTTGVRFGAMKFAAGGGQLIDIIGTNKSTLVTDINNMDLQATGHPIGEVTKYVGKYFDGSGGYTSPIQYACQPNFVILITDGLYTGTNPWDEAASIYTQDHSSSLPGVQNVIVDTIGFGIAVSNPGDVLAANDALQRTATAGGGKFYDTTSARELESALQEALQQIVAATFAFATPTIPSTQATGSSKAYLAAFQSNPSRPFWSGYLKAYQRDSNGNVPVDSNGVPTNAPVWEAGQVLTTKTAADRNIYTQVGSSRVEFKTGTTAITAAMLNVATDTDRANLIDFIRGVDTYDWDGNGNTTEDRAWKLGDIFHSTPVLVTPPIAPTPTTDDGSYAAFKANTTIANRTTILLAGADDGMLHAFRDDTGEELWGFIPPDLLPTLKLLTGGQHPYFVDGNPIVADLKISIPGDSTVKWRTVVVFGERRGGRHYSALDITDPANPIYMWQSFDDSKMGETWSSPAIGKIQMADGSTKFVAFVGGGYDTAQNNNTGKAVFAIDLSTGSKLWEYYHATGATDDSQYMNFSIPADVTAAAVNNNNGYIDRLYVGDVGGQVWKFDLSSPAALSGGLVTNWLGKRLFRADTAGANPPSVGEYYPTQAIYDSVIPALDDLQHVWIYFGTGDLNHPNNTTPPNRFYGIMDNIAMTSSTTLTAASLVDVTTASNVTVTQGWYYRMTAKDPSAPSGSSSTEKDLKSAEVFNKVVFFTTFVPTYTVSCGSGAGTAKMYAVQMLNGYAAENWTTGAPLTTTDASVTRSREIGEGIPSKPVIVITDSGVSVETSVVAATTSQQLPNNPAPPPSSMRKVLYWREIF